MSKQRPFSVHPDVYVLLQIICEYRTNLYSHRSVRATVRGGFALNFVASDLTCHRTDCFGQVSRP